MLSPIIVNDNEFKSAFAEKTFPYNSRNAKIVRYILGKIEFFKGSGREVQFDDDTVSIEHVYPQNPDDKWTLDENKMQRYVYRLGNMCLLEKRLNRDLQNADFSMKKAVYSSSSYYYAKKNGDEVEQWDESIIVRFQSEQAMSAVTIWRV